MRGVRVGWIAALPIVAASSVFAGINEWTSLGPDGGFVSALAVDPQNSGTLYAGTQSNGVFKSVDGGATWKAANSGLASGAVLALTIDPRDTATLYAAGAGVFKTTDGGTTWHRAGSALEYDYSFYTLAIDPQDSATVYAGSESGVYKTTDGGESWVLALPQFWVTSLAIDPGNPGTVYAGGHCFVTCSILNTIAKTTDGGTRWDTAVALPAPDSWSGIPFLLIDPRNSSLVYAGAGSGGVFKSVDAGATWSPANSGLPDGYTRTLALAFDPKDPSALYALMVLDHPPFAGYESGWVNHPGKLFRSTDGGGNWIEAGSGLPAQSFDPLDYCSCTPMRAGLAIDPQNSGTLYIGTGSEGVYKSGDGGASWSLSSSGLRAIDIRALAASSHSGTLYAASFSRIFRSVNAGGTWSAGPWGNPGVVLEAMVVDPRETPETIYAGSGDLEEWKTARLSKSTDGGMSWRDTSLPHHTVWSLRIDPQDPTILYAATGFGPFEYTLYKSTDGAATWSQAYPDPAAVNNFFSFFFTSPIAFDPNDSHTLYAGGSNNGESSFLLKSADGGASWTRMGLHESRITAIAIDPRNTTTLYVGSVAGVSRGVFKSTDGGASLDRASSGLPPETNVWFLLIDPQDPRKLYAETNNGVFRTTDGATTWTALNSGLPGLVNYDSLALDPGDPNTLYAGTHGGVYAITFTDVEQ